MTGDDPIPVDLNPGPQPPTGWQIGGEGITNPDWQNPIYPPYQGSIINPWGGGYPVIIGDQHPAPFYPDYPYIPPKGGYRPGPGWSRPIEDLINEEIFDPIF